MRARASRNVKHAAPPARRAGAGFAQALAAQLQRARGYLLRSVRMTREGQNIHVKLSAAPHVRAVPAESGKAALELQAMRAELKLLLNAHPTTRQLMRHLVYVDAALHTRGLAALREVPVEVLSRAVEQLETLVSNWSNVGLADLRSKMSVAVVQRSRDPFYGTGAERPSAFHTASRLHVADVSHSMFMAADASFGDASTSAGGPPAARPEAARSLPNAA
jgi:hypothetical protein